MLYVCIDEKCTLLKVNICGIRGEIFWQHIQDGLVDKTVI